MLPLRELSRYTGLLSFVIGLPATIGTLIGVLRTRREAREAREGLVFSQNCLEFVTEAGVLVNVVPLETLHSLPKPKDVVLLPGSDDSALSYQAWRISRIEFVYARIARHRRKDGAETLRGQARLAKAVAYVVPVSASDLKADESSVALLPH